MKKYKLKKFYLVVKRDLQTKAEEVIAKCSDYILQDNILIMSLVNGRALRFTTYHDDQSFDKQIFSSCFFDDTPDEKLIGRFYVREHFELVEQINPARTKFIYLGEHAEDCGKFFYFYSFWKTRMNQCLRITLCIPYKNDIVIINDVSSYKADNYKLIYTVDNEVSVFWFREEYFRHLGVGKLDSGLFNCEEEHKLYLLKEKSVKSIPYLSCYTSLGHLIVQISSNRYRIFHIGSGEEHKQPCFFTSNLIGIHRAFYLEKDGFAEIPAPKNVEMQYCNAYLVCDGETYSLYTYQDKKPFLLDSGRASFMTALLFSIGENVWEVNEKWNLIKP